MKHEYYKIDKYEKICLKSIGKNIYINSDVDPAIVYDMKDFSIRNIYKVKDYNSIGIERIFYYKTPSIYDDNNTINFVLDNINSYFTLNKDASNLPDIINKFKKFSETLFKQFQGSKRIKFTLESAINFISFYEYSDLLEIYIRNDFCDFDKLNKYDFVIMEGHYNKYNQKLVFDGECLRSEHFILEFIKKPKIDNFTVFLYDIKKVNIGFSNDDKIFSVYDYYDGVSVHFRPKTIDDFKYLIYLNNPKWIKKVNTKYDKSDIISEMYNI